MSNNIIHMYGTHFIHIKLISVQENPTLCNCFRFHCIKLNVKMEKHIYEIEERHKYIFEDISLSLIFWNHYVMLIVKSNFISFY